MASLRKGRCRRPRSPDQASRLTLIGSAGTALRTTVCKSLTVGTLRRWSGSIRRRGPYRPTTAHHRVSSNKSSPDDEAGPPPSSVAAPLPHFGVNPLLVLVH